MIRKKRAKKEIKLSMAFSQEGVKLEKEDEAINKFYRRLDRCLAGRPVVIVTNSQGQDLSTEETEGFRHKQGCMNILKAFSCLI